MKLLKRWRAIWRERSDVRLEKSALVRKITQLQDSLDDTLSTLDEERHSRDSERDSRIDRERVLRQQVRELEETIAVNKITIENLTYETTRNRERLRAEVAMSVAERKNHLEGEARGQLS